MREFDYTELALIPALRAMRQLQRRTIEKVGHCFGVSVDAKGQYHSD